MCTHVGCKHRFTRFSIGSHASPTCNRTHLYTAENTERDANTLEFGQTPKSDARALTHFHMYGPPKLSPLARRSSLEIAGRSCGFCLQRWPDSDRCWFRWKEIDGRKGLMCVCVWQGAFLNVCVACCFWCHLCVCGWYEGMRDY